MAFVFGRMPAMVVSRFVSLDGQWKPSRHAFEFSQSVDGFGIALSDQKVVRGTLSVSVSLADVKEGSGGIIIGYNPDKKTGIMATVGGWDSAYAIGEFQIGQRGTSSSAFI